MQRHRRRPLRRHAGALPGRHSDERHLERLRSGLLNAWLDVHAAYGALPLPEVLAPAIALAEDGFPVTHYLSAAIAGDRLLREFPTSRAVFTRNGAGEPMRAGDILRQAIWRAL